MIHSRDYSVSTERGEAGSGRAPLLRVSRFRLIGTTVACCKARAKTEPAELVNQFLTLTNMVKTRGGLSSLARVLGRSASGVGRVDCGGGVAVLHRGPRRLGGQGEFRFFNGRSIGEAAQSTPLNARNSQRSL